jgi:hypothetical protein
MSTNFKTFVHSAIAGVKAEQSAAEIERDRKVEKQAQLLAEAKEYATKIVSGLKILKDREGSKFDFKVQEAGTGVYISTNLSYELTRWGGNYQGHGTVSIAVGGDDRWSQQTVRVEGRGEMHLDGAKVPDARAQVVERIARTAANWGLVS